METLVGCSVIIYDTEGRVLIAQRGRTKKQFPLLWETIGGALEWSDESPEDCIRREVKEEIGCSLVDLRLFKVYVVKESVKQHVLIVFTGKIEGNIQLNYEIENVRWVSEKEIDEFEFYAASCKQKIYDFYKESTL